MFFSVNHLIGRDAKFALIWRAATYGSSKKLSRKAILGVPIVNVCREILRYTPAGAGVEADLTSKFSLYLIGQLIYGTVIIFGRQMTIFEQDVRSAYESCKRLPMEKSCDQYDSVLRDGDTLTKRRQRRSRLSITELNADIDIDEAPESRFVHLARRSDITMFDCEPLIWQRQDVFNDEENQLPIDFSKEHFINWSDQMSFESSKKSSQSVGGIDRVSLVDPNLENEDLPPFPPPEVFVNMDRESFLAGATQVVGERSPGRLSLEKSSEQSILGGNLLSNVEPETKRPRLEDDMHEHANAEQIRFKLSVADFDHVPVIQPSFELGPVHEDDATNVRRMRKRRFTQLRDMDGLTIPYDSMKKMQLDYSSLLKTKEELHVDLSVQGHPTLEQLFLPYPAYAGNRFPIECRELYRSAFCDTLTYQQAITEDIFEPVNRGPASMLWHYRGSSSDSSEEISEYKAYPGIAFLNETPNRIRRNSRARECPFLAEETAGSSVTPGRITVFATPERCTELVAEERRSDVSARDLILGALPLNADISPPEHVRFRESRSSKFEYARQWTHGSSDFERRPSSVQLFDPVHLVDISQHSILSASERGVNLSPSLKAKFYSEEGRLLMSSLAATNRFVPLTSIIPCTTTSRKRAGRVFSTILCLLGKGIIEAEQSETYGEIWLRACSPQSTDQDDASTGV